MRKTLILVVFAKSGSDQCEHWARKAAREDRKAAAREALGYKPGELVNAKSWLKWIPSPIRDGTILDLVDAENACRQKAQLARERGDRVYTVHLKEKQNSDPSGWNVRIPHNTIQVETFPRNVST